MKWGSGSLEYILPLQWCAIIAYVDNVRPLMNIWREIMLKATICTQGQASFKHMLSCDKGSSNNASKLTFEWVLKDAHLKFMIRHLQLLKFSFFNSCYTSPHFYTSSRINHKGMSRDPDRRYHKCRQLWRELERWARKNYKHCNLWNPCSLHME